MVEELREGSENEGVQRRNRPDRRDPCPEEDMGGLRTRLGTHRGGDAGDALAQG